MNVDLKNLPPATQTIDLTGDKEKGRGNFLLRPRAVMYPMVQDTTGNPQKHKDFIVINVGKAKITVELEFGTRQTKLGVLDKKILEPGDEIALQTGDGKFEVTTLRITNATKIRAAFQVEGGESILPPSAGEHYSELLDNDTIKYPSQDIPFDGNSRKIEIPAIGEISTTTKKLAITDIPEIEGSKINPTLSRREEEIKNEEDVNQEELVKIDTSNTS